MTRHAPLQLLLSHRRAPNARRACSAMCLVPTTVRSRLSSAVSCCDITCCCSCSRPALFSSAVESVSRPPPAAAPLLPAAPSSASRAARGASRFNDACIFSRCVRRPATRSRRRLRSFSVLQAERGGHGGDLLSRAPMQRQPSRGTIIRRISVTWTAHAVSVTHIPACSGPSSEARRLSSRLPRVPSLRRAVAVSRLASGPPSGNLRLRSCAPGCVVGLGR